MYELIVCFSLRGHIDPFSEVSVVHTIKPLILCHFEVTTLGFQESASPLASLKPINNN